MTSNVTAQREKTQRIVGIAIFAAIIIALQAFATAVNYVTPGTIPIALALPPIIIGAAIYGTKAGAALGLSFAFVVLGSGILGFAPTSALMWSISPVIMTAGTLGRGLAAGAVAGIVYKAVSKKDSYFGVLAAAVIAPIVNTGIFIIMLFLFFEVLAVEGAGVTMLERAIAIFISINFLCEILLNAALAPAIVRVIGIAKKARA
jgi:uncharacterized membrane protein